MARWEGDTLVVDVTGFNDKTWLIGVGTVHSEKLRVTERYTRDSYNTIRYQVTMDDPEVFTKPWNTEEIFRLRPGERIREYECIENNEDLLRIEKLLQNESVFRRPSNRSRGTMRRGRSTFECCASPFVERRIRFQAGGFDVQSSASCSPRSPSRHVHRQCPEQVARPGR